MKALVTGATGFIGTKLCRELAAKGCEIRALVFPGESYSHISGYVKEVYEGDITNPETLKGVGDGVDMVYHLAARVTDYGTWDQFYKPIYHGTKNLLEACAGKSSRFIYLSSICAYGTGRHLKGLKESDPVIKTHIPYNDAKQDAEVLVLSCNDRFKRGCTVVRPANVIGPGSVWVAEVGRMFQKSIVTLFDQGKYSASLIYIDNLVEGIILAGTADQAAGRIYNLRDNWQVTWKQYLTNLSAMLGKKPIGSLPFKFAWALGGFVEKICNPFGLRPFITRHAVGLMGRDNDVDISKAKTELGWITKVSYPEAMVAIEKWIEQNMR